MKNILRKMSVVTIITMSLSTFPVQSFGATKEVNNTNKPTIGIEGYKKIPQITTEQFNKALEQAIEMEGTEQFDKILEQPIGMEGTEQFNKSLEQAIGIEGYKKIPQITTEQFDKALEQAIEMEGTEQFDKILEQPIGMEGTEQFNKALEQPIEMEGNSIIMRYTPQSDKELLLSTANNDTFIPNLHIPNAVVSTVLNTLMVGVVVSIGCGSLTAALKIYGEDQLNYIFSSTAMGRVIGHVCIHLDIPLALISGAFFHLVNPATTAASWLDSADPYGTNGTLDVIW
jgi:hypothetical protein